MSGVDLLLVAIGDLVFAGLGALAYSWWIEWRHDCMPHEAGIGCPGTSAKKRRERLGAP